MVVGKKREHSRYVNTPTVGRSPRTVYRVLDQSNSRRNLVAVDGSPGEGKTVSRGTLD